MFSILTFLHSTLRWLVVISLVYAIITSFTGYRKKRQYTVKDNAIRHWTATIAHTQLLLGILLLTQSPTVKVFWNHFSFAQEDFDLLFFGLLHPALMICAIITLTIGSAMAKREENERQKFRTVLLFYAMALLLIIIAIPWPFSPLAHRPYFR